MLDLPARWMGNLADVSEASAKRQQSLGSWKKESGVRECVPPPSLCGRTAASRRTNLTACRGRTRPGGVNTAASACWTRNHCCLRVVLNCESAQSSKQIGYQPGVNERKVIVAAAAKDRRWSAKQNGSGGWRRSAGRSTPPRSITSIDHRWSRRGMESRCRGRTHGERRLTERSASAALPSVRGTPSRAGGISSNGQGVVLARCSTASGSL